MHLCTAVLLGVVGLVVAKDGTCLDNSGNEVDWWFTYKLPDGYQYAYYDPTMESHTGALTLWPTTLDDDSHPAALIRTLRNLLPSTDNKTADAGDDGCSYFMYNDQPDVGDPGSDYGHTKGVVGVGDSSSFWLVHSVPNFPQSTGSSKFFFPSTETDYGQTFLCMSFSSDTIDTIAGQLLYTTPYIYFNNAQTAASKHTTLQKVFNKEWVTTPGTNVASFDVGGLRFSSLAKNAAWDNDLYEYLVAPTLGSNLLVETWKRGDAIGPYCKPKAQYDVTDVENLKVQSSNGPLTWDEGQDHAKWCVTLDTSSQLCVCGINRMTTQRIRGGGCVCFKDTALHSMLNSSITSSWAC